MLLHQLSIFACAIYIIVIIYNYFGEKESVYRHIFSLICFLFAGWTLSLALMNLQTEIKEATFYRFLISLFLYPLYPSIFIFTLKLKSKKKISWLYRFLIFLPAIIGIINTLLYFPINSNHSVLTKYGWVYKTVKFENAFANNYFLFFFSLYISASMVVIYKIFRTSKLKRESIGYRIIFLSTFIASIIGGITDIYAPKASLKIIPLGSIVALIPVLSFVYVVRKYGILELMSEQTLSNILESMDEGLVLTDYNNRIKYLNNGAKEIFNLKKSDKIIGENWLDFTEDYISNIVDSYNSKSFFQSSAMTFISTKKNKESFDKILSYKNNKLVDQFGEFLGEICMLKDVSKVIEAEKQIKNSKEELENLVADRTKLLVEKTEELQDQNKKLELEIESGKRMQEEITKLAFYDVLTGLYNRRQFIKELGKRLFCSNEEYDSHAVIYIDIDDFKIINDNLGHSLGDEILKKVASILISEKLDNSIISRIDGDGFLLFLSNIDDEQKLKEYVENLKKKISVDMKLNNFLVNINTSCGVAIYPEHGTSVNELMANVDIALQEAKRERRGEIVLFETVFLEKLEKQFNMVNDIKYAIDNDEFLLYYQPQVTVYEDKIEITGVEALIRWNSSTRGFVFPNDFIPAAENSNQIIEIGRLVIRKAIKEIAELNKKHSSNLSVAINLSGKQFKDIKLCDTISKALKENDFPPHLVDLELTESSLVADVDLAVSVIQSLKEQGVKISIDDFGTEYSSLNYLKDLPIDKIKIDRSFIIEIDKSNKAEAILESIIFLINNLDLNVVAEGVENNRQLEYLVDKGCENIQGYYYYRPMPIENYEDKELYKNFIKKQGGKNG